MDLNNWRSQRFVSFFAFHSNLAHKHTQNCFLSLLKLVSCSLTFASKFIHSSFFFPFLTICQIIKLCIIFGRGVYKYPIINYVLVTHSIWPPCFFFLSLFFWYLNGVGRATVPKVVLFACCTSKIDLAM